MPTPAYWDGIFYGQETGSNYFFDDLEVIFSIIEDRPDRIFLVVGGVTDLLINGYVAIANKFLEMAKAKFSSFDWERFEEEYEAVKALIEERPEGWRSDISALVHTLSEARVPEDFVSYLGLHDELIKMLFSSRGYTLGYIYEYPQGHDLSLNIYGDCILNGLPDLASEIKDAFVDHWPESTVDWAGMDAQLVSLREAITFAGELELGTTLSDEQVATLERLTPQQRSMVSAVLAKVGVASLPAERSHASIAQIMMFGTIISDLVNGRTRHLPKVEEIEVKPVE